MLEILAEKKAVDEENRRLVEQAKKTEAKVIRTIVLPGGYRSEEDFNPGAYIPSKSLERDRFVAYNRIFGEKSAPLNFDRELTAELLGEGPAVRIRSAEEEVRGSEEGPASAVPLSPVRGRVRAAWT